MTCHSFIESLELRHIIKKIQTFVFIVDIIHQSWACTNQRHWIGASLQKDVNSSYWVLWSGLGFWCLLPVVSVTVLWKTAASPGTPPWSNSVDTQCRFKLPLGTFHMWSGCCCSEANICSFLRKDKGKAELSTDISGCECVLRWFFYYPLLSVCRTWEPPTSSV